MQDMLKCQLTQCWYKAENQTHNDTEDGGWAETCSNIPHFLVWAMARVVHGAHHLLNMGD